MKRAFAMAIDADRTAADSILKMECAGDEQMLGELRRLLELHWRPELALDKTPSLAEPLRPMIGAFLERALQPGQRLADRFEITRFLGEGGIGEVYEALDTLLDHRLALKTLHPFRAAEPSTQERFRRELDLARRITHANVCRIHDFYQAEVVFLTMELLEGETLAARLQREGALPPRILAADPGAGH